MDNGEARVVGPGHPAVRATTTFQGTNLADQARDTAGNDPVRESEYPSGSTSERTVEPRTPTHICSVGKLISGTEL